MSLVSKIRAIAPSLLVAMALLTTTATPARADITAFIGMSPTPERHTVKGFSGGLSLIIVGFEFEYANLGEDTTDGLFPGLKTYSGNVLLQTPVELKGTQFYGTAGAGGYQESLGAADETHFGLNFGGGVKIRVLGPVRLRLDYRVFRLQGEPLYPTYQRFYAGANLAF
jgi:hypothetical protein